MNWIAIAALTVCYAVKVLFLRNFRGNRDSFHQVVHTWAEKCLKATGTKFEVLGLENVDEEQRYIFMGNHCSYFDIFLFYSAYKGRVVWIAKKSLFSIPLVGYLMKVADTISVQRESLASSTESLLKAIEVIKEGDVSIVVFPEGTRSSDGTLGAFKKGGFTMASMSSLPILPFVIKGTGDVLAKGSLKIRRGKKISIEFLPPLSETDARVSMRTVRDKLLAALEN